MCDREGDREQDPLEAEVERCPQIEQMNPMFYSLSWYRVI
jgi:hypothetical protein